LHDRFGRLPFADDFGPAIWIAEHGVPFSPLLGIWFQQSSQILTRLPETKRIFTTEVGDPYKPQDLVSPAGARRHAQKGGEPGPAYFYNGEWAATSSMLSSARAAR
jgi:gamma-glutamyltranspeptidase/glutathione hydrolase